jgi:hypothetical protein
VSGVPQFIGPRILRELAWYLAEMITLPIIKRLDDLMSQVTVDSDAIDAITAGVTGLETEFEAFVSSLPTTPPAGSLDGVTSALADFKSKLDALVPAAPADPPASS